MRPLPNTIRPCHDAAHGPANEMPLDRVEQVVFPVHHVAACCMIGAIAWAGLIFATRTVLNVVVQFV